MSLYIELILGSTLLLYLADKLATAQEQITFHGFKISTQKISFNAYVAVTIVFLIFGVLRRYSVGNDVSLYQVYYYIPPQKGMEIGYLLLSRFVRSFGLNFRAFMAVIAFLTVVPVMVAIRRMSISPWKSVFLFQALYLYVNTFNIFRQSIAMAFVFLAISFIYRPKVDKRDLLIYFVLVGFACTFHVTALVFLALPILRYKVFTLKEWVVMIVISLFLFVFHKEITSFLMGLFNKNYYDSGLIEVGEVSILLFGGMVAFNAYFKKDILRRIPYHEMILQFMQFTLLFSILWVWFPNSGRLTQYSYLILTIALPNVMPILKNSKLYRYIDLIFVIIFMLFYILILGLRDYGGVVPYIFYVG